MEEEGIAEGGRFQSKSPQPAGAESRFKIWLVLKGVAQTGVFANYSLVPTSS